MTPSDRYALAAVVLAALLTFATRLAPFVLFGTRGKVPPAVEYLGRVLPPALMALLVVYCLRSGLWTMDSRTLLPQLVCAALAAGLQLWKHNELLSIGAATGLYMLLVQRVFV